MIHVAPLGSFNCLFAASGTPASGSLDWSASSYSVKSAGDKYTKEFVSDLLVSSPDTGSTSNYITIASASLAFPVFEIIPSEAISVTAPDSTYSPSGRAGSVTSYYGDVNSHNYTDSSTSIVNESNTTYYNPVTNTTSTIQDWTYDYSDRSYNLTMENGDTVTVTYGDENVTINEGDTIYNIYYVLPSSQIQEPVHEHTWVETSKTEYCTLPGEVIYTCSECGQTMTEETQVLGHTWKIIREVHTHYDEDGNQDQEGYILYECERCGEQYKASSGGTPPGTNVPSGGGAGDSGTSAGLSRVFQNSAAVISQNYGTDGHTGTDCVPAGGGTDVVIAHSEGSVVWVQTGQSNNQGSSGDASYGNCVKIKHSNGYYTLYAHLASVNVSNGQHVYKGQTLGVMGNTGNSYGAHLHFEVRDASDTNINSDPYINADLPDFAGGGTSSGSGSSGNGGGIFSSIGNLIGSLLSGILDIGGAILGKILDALTNLVELITGKLAAVVEAILGIFDEVPQMFGGFLDFLTGMFAFLPPEITTLLIFGIAAIVLIGIIKAVRR